MKNSLLLLIFLLLSPNAFAKVPNFQRVLFELGFIDDPSVHVCPESPDLDAKAGEEQLWAQARKAQDGYRPCETAKIYKSLYVNYPSSYRAASKLYVETLLDAGDYILAINEANQYIEDNIGLNESEYMHVLLLRGVYGEIQKTWQDKNRQMEFVAFSLGAALAQTQEAPYLMTLQYHSFLDRYPKSQWKNEVLGMLNESRQAYGKNVLSEARKSILKMDYVTAFQKYNVILKWGPAVGVFEEALCEMIQYHFQLSWKLTQKNLLSDVQLNILLNRKWSTASTKEERQKLSEQTRQQGQIYLEQMKANLPNSSWTLKAQEIAKGYPIL